MAHDSWPGQGPLTGSHDLKTGKIKGGRNVQVIYASVLEPPITFHGLLLNKKHQPFHNSCPLLT